MKSQSSITHKKFSKLAEEVRNLLSVIMYKLPDESAEEQGFDYYIEHASSEDAKLVKILKEDTLAREKREKHLGEASQKLNSKESPSTQIFTPNPKNKTMIITSQKDPTPSAIDIKIKENDREI